MALDTLRTLPAP